MVPLYVLYLRILSYDIRGIALVLWKSSSQHSQIHWNFSLLDRVIFPVLLLIKFYIMITALLIIYGLGLIFTWSIDLTIVNCSLQFKGWKHLITMLTIWICSPVLMVVLIVMTIKFFIKKYRRK